MNAATLRNILIPFGGLVVWVLWHRYGQLYPSKATLATAACVGMAYLFRKVYEIHLDKTPNFYADARWKVGPAHVLGCMAPCVFLAGIIW